MVEQPAEPPGPRSIPVCAIGASAGGVGALQTLFRLLPDDLGLAYVVIIHLAPDHPSSLHEILGGATRMPVLQVTDGPTLRANCVYVIAPDSELVIDGGHIRARPFTSAQARRAPIDMFFRSVAAVRGDGIAVVLTGAGSDGAVGVRAIKEAGGLIMVQEPAEAGYPSMPQNVIATGVADVIAPLARLAERIAEAARSKEAVRSLDGDGAANDVRRIIAFLRMRTGHDFSGYKRSTVLRRISRRMQVCQIDVLADYARHLRDTPEETEKLFADLLISVTTFFRDAEAFVALNHAVIQPLLEAMAGGDADGELRAWVVGCATGEEAYSLAIMLLEEAERLRLQVPIQIFATDLDEGALATAREGRYPRTIEADVSAERLKRFFVDEGTHYRISRRVRDLVLFATHSVVREPPFMRLDIITCRNVLIYLERALQQHVCGIFHYGLKPNGALFLGTAEAADASQSQFATVDREARIYRALPSESRLLPLLSTTSVAGPTRLPATQTRTSMAGFEAGEVLGAIHATALEASAPPSALVDVDQMVLHLSPSVGRFILLSAGPLSGKLPTIVRPELRLDLKVALDRVFESGQPTITRVIDVTLDGAPRRVSIHVASVPADEGLAPRAMVFFLDNGPGRPAELAVGLPPPDELLQLHGELKAAQEAELAGRIRHDIALQELRASNEELQSLNEEYRSTAEELETSKEELQSINEELQTVNAELKSKLSVISAAHNDLQNLTASSEIGTLFLDTDLRIRMFTPPVADLINVTASDAGRPITDFTHRLAYDGIERDARRVLADFVPTETEVRSLDGRWFMMRVRPYRTLENRVEGAVVTFDNVTDRMEALQSVRESEALRRVALAGGRMGTWRWDLDRRLVQGDTQFMALWGFPPSDEMQPLSQFTECMSPEGAAEMGTIVTKAIHAGEEFDGILEIVSGPTAGRWIRWRGRAAENDHSLLYGVTFDITDQRQSEAALRESEAKYRTLFETMTEGYAIGELLRGASGQAVDWRFIEFNPALERHTGMDRAASTGRWFSELFPGADRTYWLGVYQSVVDTQTIRTFEDYWPPLDRWIGGVASPADEGRFYIVYRDVSEQKRLELSLRESGERLRTLVEGLPQLVWRAGAGGEWTWSSPQWTAHTGLSEAESQGMNWLAALHPDDRAGAAATWTSASTGEVLTLETRIYNAREGGYRWFASRATAVRDADGHLTEWLGTSTDIHDLRELQDRQQVLVAELQHRTRNLMSVVRATMEETLRSSTGLDDFIGKYRDRVQALSRVQGMLSRLNNGDRITFDQLIGDEIEAVGAIERVSLSGPSGVALRSSTVQTFALALHELATNAAKYGALAQPDGRLAVTWRLEAAGPDARPWLHVDWHESGVAMPPAGTAPQGSGQGRQLIERALPYQLGARTTYVMGPDGIRCFIAVPVSIRTATGDDHDDGAPAEGSPHPGD